MKPAECELCSCEQYKWNGSSDALRSDPPTTCACGHPVSRHVFTEEKEVMTVHSVKPETPYAGTSGWSGTDTSEARVRRDDNDGTTALTQQQAFEYACNRVYAGVTVGELAKFAQVHHGKASAALSVLHKTGYLARLSETRGGAKVYVDPAFTDDRETEKHGRPNRAAEVLQEKLDRIRREAHRWLAYDHEGAACRHCAAEAVLAMLDEKGQQA